MSDERPACFDNDEQYEQWKAAAEEVDETHLTRTCGYCIDCTPSFKERMLEAGRCEHPDVTFVYMYDESCEPGEVTLIGMRPEAMDD